MATSVLYFDQRRHKDAGQGQLRIIIRHKGTTAMLSTGITLNADQWKNETIVKHPDAQFLNSVLSSKKGEVDRCLLELSTLGYLRGKTAKEIADIIKKRTDPEYAEEQAAKSKERAEKENSLLLFFNQVAESKDKPGTRQLYKDSYKKIEQFCVASGKDPLLLRFDDITKTWLISFEQFCLKTERQNTASRHLRDLRAVFNTANDEGKTTLYPFRRYTIKKEETIDKAYSAKELRRLFSTECCPGGEQKALDMFKLMFCLIGINSVDLANATKIERGRLNYIRKKTHKPYSIKIEPEAQTIIDTYAGKEHLVDILEKHANYKTYFNRMAKTLRKVGKERVSGQKSKGQAALADICCGSARTSWATIAQEELDIPREIIAAALGHHTVDVTTTYLRTDWRKKVDHANRQVLDWVFLNKRTR